MIKINVKVRESTNGISNKYSINSFYYSTRNHTLMVSLPSIVYHMVGLWKFQAFVVPSVIQHNSRLTI